MCAVSSDASFDPRDNFRALPHNSKSAVPEPSRKRIGTHVLRISLKSLDVCTRVSRKLMNFFKRYVVGVHRQTPMVVRASRRSRLPIRMERYSRPVGYQFFSTV